MNRRLLSDWYTPTRLHDAPVDYDVPGDRFIPTRSLMDIDQARGELTYRTPAVPPNSKFNNLTLAADGRPFKMLVFRGIPKSRKRISAQIDEMRRGDEMLPTSRPLPLREFPKSESHLLDAHNIKCNYLLNIMDWGKTNILAVGLGAEVYLWNSKNHKVELLCEGSENDYPASVSWSGDGKKIATGYAGSRIRLFDAESLKPIRWLHGHQGRVGSIAWNGHLLTSGSSDRAIINHDVRAKDSLVCNIKAHKRQVCGLKWSSTGTKLASGGNDHLLFLWDARKMSSDHHLYRFNQHCGAVKALAWCPTDYNVLASGGGTSDGSIKIWNLLKGTCTSSTETKAQITGLQWNRHHKELLSGHGFGTETEYNNRMCLWRYPSMSKLGESGNLGSRILHLTQSSDGATVVSAGEDERLRFWEVFGPTTDDGSKVPYMEGLFSLNTSTIRRHIFSQVSQPNSFS